MLTTLTEQDVLDAHMAHCTKKLAHTEQCPPESLIRSLESYEGQADAQIATYQRGLVLLRDYIVLSSERSVVGGQFDAETEERIVSPIVTVESGYLATSLTYRAVALAQR